jgi:hypothetical protein
VRLPTHLLVAALLRRVNDAGGMAMVRASGDAQTGAILALVGQGAAMRALERVRDLDGRDSLIAAGPQGGGETALEDYWRKRRAGDPDLWVIELDIPDGERLVAETIAAN